VKPAATTRCITCGQVVTHPPALNHLKDGASCPTCVERVLESLPPALPGRSEALSPLDGDDWEDEGEPWQARYLEGGSEDEDRPA
jgi:DNA-directed RNA polymerase subunit RPC12/RpoP